MSGYTVYIFISMVLVHVIINDLNVSPSPIHVYCNANAATLI